MDSKKSVSNHGILKTADIHSPVISIECSRYTLAPVPPEGSRQLHVWCVDSSSLDASTCSIAAATLNNAPVSLLTARGIVNS